MNTLSILALWERRQQLRKLLSSERVLDGRLSLKVLLVVRCVATIWIAVTLIGLAEVAIVQQHQSGFIVGLIAVAASAFFFEWWAAVNRPIFYYRLLRRHVKELAVALVDINCGNCSQRARRVSERELVSDYLANGYYSFFKRQAYEELRYTAEKLMAYIAYCCMEEGVDPDMSNVRWREVAGRYQRLQAALNHFDMGLRPLTSYVEKVLETIPQVGERINLAVVEPEEVGAETPPA